ncbi:hypothetical protein MPH_11047 [Macrophomina phaseolina MS6]|uniref:Uncharacterized protein n=1 Tax=Macrophomina phaseolina (strain MS6) TaxID=1126212 RepID=K2RN08_MACPH|nr:hypothetical protein MPH_11047 [Macrophomina phaseolina MS6]
MWISEHPIPLIRVRRLDWELRAVFPRARGAGEIEGSLIRWADSCCGAAASVPAWNVCFRYSLASVPIDVPRYGHCMWHVEQYFAAKVSEQTKTGFRWIFLLTADVQDLS